MKADTLVKFSKESSPNRELLSMLEKLVLRYQDDPRLGQILVNQLHFGGFVDRRREYF